MYRTNIARRKAKKSYTLSRSSVAFLETMRKKRRGNSASAVLEDILQALQRQQRTATLEKAVADYYSSLSDAEEKEQVDWGNFALREFPKERR